MKALRRNNLMHADGRRAERGLALPLAMMVSVLVLVSGLAYIELTHSEAADANSDVHGLKALAAAERGLERAQTMSDSQKLPWSFMTYYGGQLAFYQSGEPLYGGNRVCPLFTNELVGDDGTTTYSVVIEDLNSFMPASNRFRIHAFGYSGDQIRHVSVDASTLTYAAFGWLTDSENGVYFASGDRVDGWVYTNDLLNIHGNPVFTGRVNSAASSVNYSHGGPPWDNPDFQQGLTLNSPVLDMSTLLTNGHITAIRSRAIEDDGIWLASNEGRPYEVTFHDTGEVTIRKQVEVESGGGGWWWWWWGGGTTLEWETVLDHKDLSDVNGAIYIEDHVEVKGELDGQVTLATPAGKDITITDDLVYVYPPDKAAPFEAGWDPDAHQEFDSKLGLAAGRDIVIDKSWSGGWSDMYVMGSMLAATGSFRNENYTSYPVKTLHVYGGIAQDTRGPVGLVDGRGFLKDYKYDQRFYSDPPPHFPTASYDYTGWDQEIWIEEEN